MRVLPVRRGQHFRSLTPKAGVVYAATVFAILTLGLFISFLVPSFPVLATTVLDILDDSLLPKVLVLALNVPLLCWRFATFRSTAGYLLFFFVYVMFAAIFFNRGAENALLELDLIGKLVLTAVCWLPFLGIAWKRCNRDDLVRS